MRDMSLVWSFIRPRWKSIAVGSIFVVITNLLDVLIPSMIGKAVDILSRDFLARELYYLCGLILFIELVKGISRFLMRYIIIGASWRIENDIRLRLFYHLLKLPQSYYNRVRTGDIIARVTNDLTAVRMMVGPAVMYTMNAIVLVPAALAFMFALDAELALYAVVPFPFIAIMINRVGKRIHKDFKVVQESYSDISAHVQENFDGIRAVKSYGREDYELDELQTLSWKYVQNNRRVIRLQAFFHPFLDIMASAGVILLLWVGAKKVAAGETSLGTIVSLIMYIGQLVWPSIAMGWVVAIYQRGTASSKRVGEILEETPERHDDGPGTEPLDGKISVEHLHYSYNTNDDVLKDISFSLKQGGTLAVVGRTGSGKSTLLGLLSGHSDVPRDRIYYDGIDINDIPLSKLRSSIALVPQETFLFSESVAENIAFGREDADEDSIRKAAVLAVIHKEIDSYPDGYSTVLGERGLTVSGGQRQRIAIARALISTAPIILFDDCLSNVDIASEMKILSNINEIIHERTAIIVTQRLGAVKDADEIIYMKDGAIIERGNHDELMKLNGEYASLYNEQESLNLIENGTA